MLLKGKTMKKIILGLIVSVTATFASAVEVGITTTRDYSTSTIPYCSAIPCPAMTNRNGTGFNVSDKAGRLGVTVGLEMFTRGSNPLDRLSTTLSYDWVKSGSFSLAPKVGIAYIDTQYGRDGFALTTGLGITVPVTKTISFTADYWKQLGQSKIKEYDGTQASIGLRYRF